MTHIRKVLWPSPAASFLTKAHRRYGTGCKTAWRKRNAFGDSPSLEKTRVVSQLHSNHRPCSTYLRFHPPPNAAVHRFKCWTASQRRKTSNRRVGLSER